MWSRPDNRKCHTSTLVRKVTRRATLSLKRKLQERHDKIIKSLVNLFLLINRMQQFDDFYKIFQEI